ncbi:HAD family hydrolase [Labrenzia sp. CE80]|uniref:HAD family hydrolase n=1 Tax=Labrenzia sp. CE80 TaxID=1788986 RepID=UPI001389C744|nr:HAD family hydrolase [Labrenzia sp. CE80]
MTAIRFNVLSRLLSGACALLFALSVILTASSAIRGPLLPGATIELISLIVAFASGAGLLAWQMAGDFRHKLDVASLAVATLSLAAAGAFYLSGTDPEQIIAPLFSAVCLASGRALANAARQRFPDTVDQDEIWVLRQAYGAIALALVSLIGWWATSGPTEGLIAGTASLALAWPYAPELTRALILQIGIRKAQETGVELNGADALTAIAASTAIAFDNPTLLADGQCIVTDVHAFDKGSERLLAVAATTERYARHPIGAAIRSISDDWSLPRNAPDEWEEVSGLGAVALINGRSVAVGNTALMARLKVDCFMANSLCKPLQAAGKTCVIVSVGERAVGILGLQGTPHPQAHELIGQLKTMGIESLLVTGAHLQTAEAVGASLGVDDVTGDIRQRDRFAVVQSKLSQAKGLYVGIGASDRRGVFALSSETRGEAVLLATLPAGQLDPLADLLTMASRMDEQTRLVRGFNLALRVLSGLLGAVALVPATAAPLVFALGLLGPWLIADKLANRLKF